MTMACSETASGAAAAAQPLRDVTQQEIEAFERDGVVCLRKIIPPEWVARLEQGLDAVFASFGKGQRMHDADLADPALLEAVALSEGDLLKDEVTDAEARAAGGRNRTMIGTTAFNEDMRAVALESPLTEIVAQLSRSARVNFYDDQVFLKEPGSALRTAFHQDRGYFKLKGEKVLVCWFTCDSVGRENGAMGYVPGSHRWGDDFKPIMINSRKSVPGIDGQEVPNIEADEEGYKVVYHEVEPGDLLVHNYRTLHGSSGNVTATRRRRAASFRYAGDDVVFWNIEGAPPMPHWTHQLGDGDPLGGEQFPQVWPRA